MALPRQPVTLTPQSIDRDRQLAELLFGNAQRQPTQGVGTLIGNLAQTLAGQRRFQRASSGEEQLRQQERDTLASVLGGLPGSGGSVGGVSLADVLSSPNPALQNVGGSILESQLRGDEDLLSQPAFEQRLQLRRAGRSTTNVNVGLTEPAKLQQDRDRLLSEGATTETPAVKAIDRRLEEIGAPPEQEGVPANEAGRRAMIEGGANALITVINSVFPNGIDGPADMQAIMALSLNVGETGRLARSNLREVISAILRLETGAAQTAEELDDALARFAPSVLDSDEVVRDKLTRLQTRLQRALDLVDPGSANLKGQQLMPADQTELDALRRAQGGL